MELSDARAIAVGPDDQWYVAGDRAIHVLSPDGAKQRQVVLKFEPLALAVAGADHAQPGRVYLAERSRVHVLDLKKDEPPAAWEDLGVQVADHVDRRRRVGCLRGRRRPAHRAALRPGRQACGEGRHARPIP